MTIHWGTQATWCSRIGGRCRRRASRGMIYSSGCPPVQVEATARWIRFSPVDATTTTTTGTASYRRRRRRCCCRLALAREADPRAGGLAGPAAAVAAAAAVVVAVPDDDDDAVAALEGGRKPPEETSMYQVGDAVAAPAAQSQMAKSTGPQVSSTPSSTIAGPSAAGVGNPCSCPPEAFSPGLATP